MGRSARWSEVDQMANGGEFAPLGSDLLAYQVDGILGFCRLGKPADSTLIEAFNSKQRGERVNTH